MKGKGDGKKFEEIMGGRDMFYGYNESGISQNEKEKGVKRENTVLRHKRNN